MCLLRLRQNDLIAEAKVKIAEAGDVQLIDRCTVVLLGSTQHQGLADQVWGERPVHMKETKMRVR